MKVALYARVSTEEQAKHGISVDAQLAALREWAEKEGHNIVGEYVDNGVSARKAPTKRPELQRLLADLERGEIKLIAFTKLDRWTRNVKGYYAVQDALDRVGVAWVAIHEDYETITASGRFKVNIMLSVAENEADRTSERIKRVMDFKVAKGECINPGGLPMGYSYDAETKRVVPNEDAQLVREAFLHYVKTGSIRDTLYYLVDDCGKKMVYRSLSNMLHNRLYTGEYRGNAQFCEPIIDRAIFEKVQEGLADRSVRHNPSNRVYVFSSLIYCGACGRKMVGVYHNYKGDTAHYLGYRCPRAYQSHICPHRKFYDEKKIERYLVQHIAERLEEVTAEAKPAAKKKVKKADIAAIKSKLNRLSELYVEGIIEREKFNADREKLTKQLEDATAKPPAGEYAAAQKIVIKDFAQHYATLTAQERRELWRSILDRIEIDSGNIRFYFLK